MSRLRLAAQFARFAQHAEEEGAVHAADEVCRAEKIDLTGLDERGAYTTGCNGESLFDLPGEDLKKPAPVRVCVVDDMAYKFPRYGG